jgi:hemolysin III
LERLVKPDPVISPLETPAPRLQSPREELANSLSAGIGLAAALATVPLLAVTTPAASNPWARAGCLVFSVTLTLGYLTSTIYHAWPRTPLKRLFRALDHAGIYLLIAGTYTPFALGPLRGPGGWVLFGLVWALAVGGILLKAFGGARYHRYSTLLYLGLGWMGLLAAKSFWHHVPLGGLAWILAGGVAYTTGVAFYVCKRLPFHHLIWHLFILAGSGCHFCAVYWYARP